ncbi:uncharacterized protein LOC119965573 [Scyliorhinus canicula]|uniref:uncharacterized protein LOC119965573 n=1 Tax=Scyliorhinus canicula TaxID=7830 RepID=UPI0018F294A2|nr:uncharacterized protein LOC119965573 [Scyliorhinus canicula]
MLDWILSALTLALGVTISHVTGTVLIQSPQVVKVPEGETVKFLCDLQSDHVDYTVDKYDAHWYYPESKELILSHYVDGRVYRARGLSDRFQPSRDVAGNSYILTVRDVKLDDSAVYICGIWGEIFGNGTRLNVTSANAPVLIQSPSLERVTEGQTARLQCTMRNAAVTHTDVHWNRELPGKDMERVLTHDIKNNTQRSPGFTERFHPSRDTSNKTFILTISNVQPSDTAVYYCSVWGDISGNGSQLNVTKQSSDKNPRTSDVIVLSTGIILAFVVLFCFALLTCYLVKKRLHSAKNSTQRIPDEDQNPVYATVGDKTRSSNQEVQEAPPAPLNLDDSPADSDPTYTALQQPTSSVYSEIKASSGRAGDQSQAAGDRNPRWTGSRWNLEDSPADSDPTYTALQQPTLSEQ